jgi:hypothetical protein
MPAIYAGEPSSFRAVVDTLRIARAVLAPVRPASSPARALQRDPVPVGVPMVKVT